MIGIIYCTYKQQVDRFLIRTVYWILPLSFFMSACLINQRVLAALVGILFSLSLSLILGDRCDERFIRLSKYTYTIFLLSYFPQMFIRGPIAFRFPEVNSYAFSVLSFFVGFFTPVLIGVLVDKMKLKNRLFTFLAHFVGL